MTGNRNNGGRSARTLTRAPPATSIPEGSIPVERRIERRIERRKGNTGGTCKCSKAYKMLFLASLLLTIIAFVVNSNRSTKNDANRGIQEAETSDRSTQPFGEVSEEISCSQDEHAVTVEVIPPDQYASDISWEISDMYNQDAIEFLPQGVYQNNIPATNTVCLIRGPCYNFTITDIYDATEECCRGRQGTYHLMVDGVNLTSSATALDAPSTSTHLFGASCTTCENPSEMAVELRIVPDDNPGEIFWSITDGANNIVTTEKDLPEESPLQAQVETTFVTCVPRQDCFEFMILDSFGDGICCGSGNGRYSLFVDGAVVVGKGGEYETLEATKFGSCDVATSGSTTLFSNSMVDSIPEP